jgi:ABC-2 type transport system ATP-binding protein
MERTADHVIVIGKGKLVADTSMAEFTRQAAGDTVRVVSPQALALEAVLAQAGGSVTADPEPSALLVSGLDAARIGELALEHGIVLHELAAKRNTLEHAFMELTRDQVEYQSHPNAPAEQEVANV